VIIRAIKTIKPGDEITYDYGKDYYRNVITPSGCRCDKCRERRAEARAKLRARAKRKKARDTKAARHKLNGASRRR
jgi:SET domain-containing protein